MNHTTDIIFAKPAWAAGSYVDFWRLVELAGYPIVDMAEMDFDSDNCYLFSTHDTHFHHGWPDARCRLIYYDLEHYPDVDLSNVPGVECWASDAAYAQRQGIKYVMMGSDERLAGYCTDQWVHETKPRPKLYDACLLSYMTYRRLQVEGDLKRRGVTLAPSQGLAGRMRHEVLLQSRAMIYVHQRDEYQAVAPQRFALAAAYSLPVISETLPNRNGFGYSNLLISDYAHLAEFAQMWLHRNDAHMLADYGLALHTYLCRDHTFRMQVEANV